MNRLDRTEYHRAYQKARRDKLRSAWIAAHGPCARCGSSESLEIDHIDRGSKHPTLIRRTGTNFWLWSEQRRTAELAKCQVLCHACHSRKSGREATKPLVHGTSNAYKEKSCRCSICKEWNRQNVRRVLSLHQSAADLERRRERNRIVKRRSRAKLKEARALANKFDPKEVELRLAIPDDKTNLRRAIGRA